MGMMKNNSDQISQLRLALNLQGTAAALGISEISVRRLVRRGLPSPSRALRTLVFPLKEIERFLAATTTEDRP